MNTENIINETILNTAKQMFVAAKTAPKARGRDNLVMKILDKSDIFTLSGKMIEIAKETGVETFRRDAENILLAPYMLLIGTRISSAGLKKCGMCGFPNCDEKNKNVKTPCVFNTGDLGIAIGSAVSIAMDHRIDNRIMYTVGQAAIELEILGKDVTVVYGIPLTATAKNPFFDRK
jgi:uncharacterized ferredoxin-like protein